MSRNYRSFKIGISGRVWDIAETHNVLDIVMKYTKTYNKRRRRFYMSKLSQEEVDTLLNLGIAEKKWGEVQISSDDIFFSGYMDHKEPLEDDIKRKGAIYIATDASGYHKIGHTRTTKKKKEKSMQTYNPTISIIHMAYGSTETEKELHKRFESKRIKLEWFDLTEDDLQWIRENHEVVS